MLVNGVENLLRVGLRAAKMGELDEFGTLSNESVDNWMKIRYPNLFPYGIIGWAS